MGGNFLHSEVPRNPVKIVENANEGKQPGTFAKKKGGMGIQEKIKRETTTQRRG